MEMKSNIRIAIATIVALLAPVTLFASSPVAGSKTETGSSYILCNAETSVGVCDTGTIDNYTRVDKFSSFTAFLTESGTGSSCDVYVASKNEDVPGTSDLSTLSANKINSVALSATQDKITFSGPFYYLWIDCTAVASTSTTVVVQGSVGTRRY